MKKDECCIGVKMIESNPEILNGMMVFSGTRVPVSNLFDYLKAGDSIEDFLDDFPTVSLEQIKYVLQSAEVAFMSREAA